MPIESGVIITIDRVEEEVKRIEALTKTMVMVGVPSSTAGRKEGPITNAALAYIHEHGSPVKNIPARPFLGPAVNALQDTAKEMLQKAAEFELDGEHGQAVNTWNALGLMAQGRVKLEITTGKFAPLADATIRARLRRGNKSDKPLIDTAQLLGSINYVIRTRK